jgi:hypothetical protein
MYLGLTMATFLEMRQNDSEQSMAMVSESQNDSQLATEAAEDNQYQQFYDSNLPFGPEMQPDISLPPLPTPFAETGLNQPTLLR